MTTNPQGWRDAPIGHLELPEWLCDRLTRAGLGSVGRLVHTIGSAPEWHSGIRGVGPHWGAAIESALNTFLASRDVHL